MAYFAQLNENNVVIQVIAIDNSVAPDPAPENSEPLGQTFISTTPPDGLGLPGTWMQTSYNGNFRKQYCGPGFRYDADADVFVAPQPFPSWTIDDNHDWQPPSPRPTNGDLWVWNEETTSWIEVGE